MRHASELVIAPLAAIACMKIIDSGDTRGSLVTTILLVAARILRVVLLSASSGTEVVLIKCHLHRGRVLVQPI